MERKISKLASEGFYTLEYYVRGAKAKLTCIGVGGGGGRARFVLKDKRLAEAFIHFTQGDLPNRFTQAFVPVSIGDTIVEIEGDNRRAFKLVGQRKNHLLLGLDMDFVWVVPDSVLEALVLPENFDGSYFISRKSK